MSLDSADPARPGSGSAGGSVAATSDSLFSHGGELGRVMSGWDWAATPVGPVEGWSANLRSVVRILLTSRFSMWMGWGPELAFFYNDAYQRDTLRAKHPWALGRPAQQVWAEIWDDIGPRIRSVLETGESTWDEGLQLFLERSGYLEETYHTFSYSPLHDDDGRIAGFLCVVSETTEQVLGERRLRVLRELGDISAVSAPTVRDACSSALGVLERARADLPSAAIYLLDGERPERASAHRVAWYGSSGDEPVPPETLRRDREPGRSVWAAFDSGRPHTVQRPPATTPGEGRAEGPARPETVLVLPIAASGGGDPVGVLLAGVSPYRYLDDEYRQFLELVAGQVANAVADASAYQAQRRRAEELAELDRAKTEFFTGVSHELRTPLTLITGPVEDSLADTVDPLPPTQRVRAELIARNGARLRRLVDTLLEFARLEGGALTPRRVPTDLAALTRGIGESFAPAVHRAGLGFTLDCPDLGALVSVDPEMWEKIVLNLLSNAVKYTLSGEVSLRLGRGGGGEVELAVSDTGIGIPAEEQHRLFERFHRVRGAAGRSHEGSGIGLALVAELAALHGGTAGVLSAPERGSRFTVSLPPEALLGPDDPPGSGEARPSSAVELYRDEALQWSTEAGGGAPLPVGGARLDVIDVGATAGATVLIVEDNPDLRRFLAGLLGPFYAVLLATDGREGLDRVRADRPDLVLTDVMMPRLDGFELLAELRSDPVTAAIPVIVLSARAGQEATAAGLAAGADDYLVKPFSSHDLLARVRANLAMARLRSHEGAWRIALLNALGDGLFISDGADGPVVEINEAFSTILGYASEDLPFAQPYPWWPEPGDDPEGAVLVERAQAELRSAGRGRWTLPMRHRDGRRVWVDCSTDAVAGRDGATQMIVGIVRDVSDQHRAAERDRMLAETGRLLTQPGDLTARLDAFVGAYAALLDELVVVSCTGPDGRMSPVAAAHPDQPEHAATMLGLGSFRLPESLAAAYRAGEAFVLDPTPEEMIRAAYGEGRALDVRREMGIHSTLIAPLAVSGRLIGVVLVVSTAGRRRFDQGDLELADELARRVAAVIDADRITTREHQLNTTGAALAAATTVVEAAEALADTIIGALGASGVAVYTASPETPGRLRLEHTLGLPDEFIERFSLIKPGDRLPLAEAARTGEALWLGDQRIRGEDPDRDASDGWLDARAVIALPLTVGERVVGVVGVSFLAPREFQPEERAFAMTLAAQAAQAFDRAVLTDARWRVAQTLQHSLLPQRLPDIDGLALATHYQPAGRLTQAGGDWYDVVPLDDERVGIVVGDVAGNGAAAAAVMGQLRSALSGFLLAEQSPGAALRLLNRVAARIDGALATTVVCFVLNTRTRELRWARAGHPPPLLLAPRNGPGQPERGRFLADALGPALGARAGAAGSEPNGTPTYTEGYLTLTPGSSVLLYTDGLIERRHEVIDDGLDRLLDAVAPHTSAAPAALLDRALAGALPASGPTDDVALVVVRLLPEPLRRRLPAEGDQLAVLRRSVRGWAVTAGLGEDQTTDLQLALGEAAANAVDHAYPPDRPGGFSYDLELNPDGSVQVAVTDEGTWRPVPTDNGYRGRGLAMIRSLGRDVSLDTAGGTRIEFTVPVEPAAPARPAAPGSAVPAPAAPAPAATGVSAIGAAEPAEVEVEHAAGGTLTFRLAGELDLASVEPVRATLLRHLGDGTGPVIVDIRAVSYLASAGVRMLVEAAGIVGDRLRLRVEPGSPADRILTLTEVGSGSRDRREKE
ncbi:MAG TPA: SpoIIE family protein phosphatase [Pseudonocardia sp.]